MKPFRAVLLTLSLAACVGASQGATVFLDDFSDPDGTPLDGRLPNIGSAWDLTEGAGLNVVGGRIDTTGAARQAFGGFTAALGSGQSLTLSYDTVAVAGNNSFNGYEGISLFVGNNEEIFTGSPNAAPFYGVAGGGLGGDQIGTDATPATTVTFTYAFDTGAWSFSTATGGELTGTGTANLALDRLRIANGNGGDIAVDNIKVDVVPEPGSFLLLGIAGLAFISRRRK